MSDNSERRSGQIYNSLRIKIAVARGAVISGIRRVSCSLLSLDVSSPLTRWIVPARPWQRYSRGGHFPKRKGNYILDYLAGEF